MNRRQFLSKSTLLTTGAAVPALWRVLPAQAAVTIAEVEQALRHWLSAEMKSRNPEVTVEVLDEASMQAGRFKWIELRAEQAERKRVKMSNLLLKGYDVQVDLPKLLAPKDPAFETKSVGSTKLNVSTTKEELNQAFSYKKILDEFQIDFVKSRLVISGIYPLLSLNNKIRVEGGLQPQGSAVLLVDAQGSINGVPVPQGIVKKLVNNINPLIDFSSIPFSPKIKEAILTNNTLTLRG